MCARFVKNAAEPIPSAPVDDTVAQLAKIDGLKKRGVITEEEYAAMRKKALGLSADSDSD